MRRPLLMEGAARGAAVGGPCNDHPRTFCVRRAPHIWSGDGQKRDFRLVVPGQVRWGGWGSNPRPADYENYGRVHRAH